jgi:hypothetical protein
VLCIIYRVIPTNKIKKIHQVILNDVSYSFKL